MGMGEGIVIAVYIASEQERRRDMITVTLEMTERPDSCYMRHELLSGCRFTCTALR